MLMEQEKEKEKETVIFNIEDDIPNPGGAKIETVQTPLNDYAERAKKFVKENNVSLTILTPAYGSQLYVNYANSLINTINMCNQLELPIRVEFCRNDSLISRARNNLVAKALSDEETTHIMFIDADISWSPIDVLNMIMSDKDIIGGAYPLKSHEWQRLLEEDFNAVKNWITSKNATGLRDRMTDIEIIKQRLLRYNINLLSKELTIENNLMAVRHTATGFMMIKRGVFKQMQQMCPELKYRDNTGYLVENEHDNAFALFEPSICEGMYMSEDWTFCERWNKMGEHNRIYIDVGIQLTHIGVEEYTGAFMSLLV